MKDRILRCAALAVWSGALIMSVALIIKVHNLKKRVEQMDDGMKQLVHDADDLRKSSAELHERMERLTVAPAESSR